MKTFKSLMVLFFVFCLFVMPVSAGVIENRNFVLNYDGWTDQTGGTGSVVASVTWVEISETTHEGQVNFYTHSAFTGPVFANLYQSINVTGVNEISYQGKSGGNFDNRGEGGTGGGDSFEMTIGGLTQSSPINTSWDTYTLNVSSLSGVHTLKFELYTYVTSTGTITGDYAIKDVRTDADVASPDYTVVSWDHDIYYTGNTANITTEIYDFDDTTYSYYIDLYNTLEYLTTYEITSETQTNYYTFPVEWGDTSLLAKLIRVTDPYATNEITLAMDLSHFETLEWDSTISFDQTSYNPGDTLKVVWSGAPSGASVWLQSGDDGGHIEHNVSYSGSFYFTVPENTQETSYRADIAYSGTSQAMAVCTINVDIVPDYSTAVINIGSFYANRSGWVPPIQAVAISQNDSVKFTIHSNMHPDYYNLYYSPDADTFDTFFTDFTIVDQYVSDTYWTYIDGVQAYQTITNITVPNADGGVYRIKFEAVNITTQSSDSVETWFNVGSFDVGIDIYNYYSHNGYYPDIKYIGTDISVPYNDLIIFGVLTDEIINTSSFKINDVEEVGVSNVTSDYFLRRGHQFTEIGKNTVEIEVTNTPTGSTDTMTWNVFVSGTTVPDGVIANLYWLDTHVNIGDSATVFYETDNITNPVLYIESADGKESFEQPIQEGQSGSYEIYPTIAKQYATQIVDEDGTVYAQVYLWVAKGGSEWRQDPDDGSWIEVPDEPVEEIPTQGTIDMVITFLTMPAFWGMIIWVGVVGGASQSNAVNRSSTGYIAFAFGNILAVVGMFAPYTMYILVILWIGAGVFFKLGKEAAGSEEY